MGMKRHKREDIAMKLRLSQPSRWNAPPALENMMAIETRGPPCINIQTGQPDGGSPYLPRYLNHFQILSNEWK